MTLGKQFHPQLLNMVAQIQESKHKWPSLPWTHSSYWPDMGWGTQVVKLSIRICKILATGCKTAIKFHLMQEMLSFINTRFEEL